MEILTVREFKARFSSVLKKVIGGQEVGISYGKNKDIVARLVPQKTEKEQRRKIGILEGKGKVIFQKDFKLTEQEFLGL